MRNLLTLAVALCLVLGLTSFASAEEKPVATAGTAPATAVAPTKIINNTTAAIGMGLSVLGIGLGLGLIGFAALSGIARQPEQAGAIQGAMFIIAGLVEGAGIISLVLCLVTIFV
ncbi:ATP synthase F0 subunit C [Fimbriiglobus ruber]|uniref:ATP synthase F(0) sector subunit c n=1 Tax=Fimbriiglobus ruber TaxID=1908690 RepID=A0A225E079_9BACT|nr:ATP synthase F0 sector subunit c [Fimbriiglobus ruber]